MDLYFFLSFLLMHHFYRFLIVEQDAITATAGYHCGLLNKIRGKAKRFRSAIPRTG